MNELWDDELILFGGCICFDDPIDEERINFVHSKHLPNVMIGNESKLGVLGQFILYYVKA